MILLLFTLLGAALHEVYGDEKLIEAVCPYGLMFNFQKRVCETPMYVYCDSEWQTFPNPCISTPYNVPLSPDQALLAHESSCSKYYSCNNEGYAYVYQCLGGNYFNNRTKKCDLPANAGCTIQGGLTNPTLNACNETLGGPFTCAGKGQGLFPYPNSRNTFYLCNGNSNPADVFVGICPNGTLFSRAHSACRFPDPSGCEFQLTSQPTVNPCVAGGVNVPDPNYCNKYFICSGNVTNGIVAYPRICAKTTIYDSTTLQCVNGQDCLPGSGKSLYTDTAKK